ncbi:zinc-binding alcohol dehydrogenase family protein [Phanerochaete sordida]|uniref:Zinc-binding alcohol dehydrogenase family protein n=1 Tax=Phanerochaete sordida TaxID=48140 RepID=A0A9P3LC42_9APHY|nr:zinc-binding alcohol dehydrogenase family protein [Phanerochaete sordida]
MATQKALYLPEPKVPVVIQEREINEPGPGEVLIEIHAAALNPSDWKIQALGILVTKFPIVLGIDSAGIVKKVGAGVTNVAVGDRVMHVGFRDVKNATFQQYTIAPAEIVAKIPPGLTFNQAATLPLAVSAAVTGLYDRNAPNSFGITPPWEEGGRGKYAGEPILVIGGASGLGQQAIQFAKLSGFSPIITTASPQNEAFLKSLGATHVIDRSAPLPAAVQAITTQPITRIFDAISSEETQNAAYDALTPGGKLVIVLWNLVAAEKLVPEKRVEMVITTFWAPERRELGKSLCAHLPALVEAGEIKPNNVEVLPGGLTGIPAGLEKLRKGVSALKLVAHPQETP